MNHLKKTRETYRKIAADYALAWQKRGSLDADLQKFMALLPEDATVLDVGCGPGMDTAVLQTHHLNAIGLDYSHEMMRAGRDNQGYKVPFAQADMRQLPIGQQIDGIWASASMLHLNRDDLLPTLQQFWRVLKPNGVLYLSVKLGDGEKWVPTTKYGHTFPRFFTFWQPETMDRLLETAAFHIIDGWEELKKRDTWLVRLAQKLKTEAGR
ncbi:class I SAM-dependent methyltransferase [Candidatus Leptofilum sp.]|uniref:class I SAM-dependent methyltransferase n=1 Tax=Candidatus Leptofilum sp. TaxID=3241576 RepID=UPI003B59D607